MSTVHFTAQIVPGATVQFVDNDESLVTGLVNGDPQLWMIGENLTVLVPVHVRDGNRCLMVHGYNLRAVLE